ncbi:sensor histidine kinase [Marinicrinis lubricantis]|uniref:Sensor histidine kinase n=1 Tax=Marinicrinis lubricantis TaxID=2086470 RepID=A0ABW1IKW5_9BACL
MFRQPRVLFITAFLVVGLLVMNNTLYYFSTKQMLETDLQEKVEAIARHIRISVQHSETGKKFVEELMAEQLRTASLVAKYALDPDIENITNEQLERLRDEIGISDITLFKKTEDDFIGYRSSAPEQIGLSTKHMGYWFESFNELYKLKPVTVERGQVLPNFWSGPFEVANSDISSIDKWGYFYDGTTNYMIDPYIHDDNMNRYDQLTGPTAVVDKLLEENEYLKEITVFNYGKFGSNDIVIAENQHNEKWVRLIDRPILYGTYTYANEDQDVIDVERAMKEQKVINYVTTINGNQVLKSFIPVADTEHPYVIGIVSDYSSVQSTLNHQLTLLGLTILLATLFSLIIIFFMFRFVRSTKDIAVQSAQVAYIQQVNEMFTTIRGQRHDFLNHVQTIHTMVQMGKIDALKQYTGELMGEIKEVNEYIRIGHPAIAAIVKAKFAVAVGKKIDFTYRVCSVEKLKFGVKSVDIVKIIGNLLDNAFDEVSQFPPDQRQVDFEMKLDDRHLMMKVKNRCRPLTDEVKQNLFNPGFSTKQDQLEHDHSHDGIGLAVTKERVQHYKGTIDVEETDGFICFNIVLPIDND